jgi:GT2 family glycosyltransferase
MISRDHITVVVCTYNRADVLLEALASLVDLRTGDFTYDVLVVDNASSDATPTLLAEFVAAHPDRFQSIREPRPGVSAARNTGVRTARGPWIAFFDDDQLADPDWLAELFRLAQRKQSLLTGGSVLLKLPCGVNRRLDPFCRVLLGETVGRDSEQPYTRKVAPGCGNLLIHRSLFDQVGLFDESLTSGGEDTDLYRRLRAAGVPGWFTPSAIVWHLIPRERLTVDKLEWTATRIGGHVARRERREQGRAGRALMLAIRATQWCLAKGPKQLRAWWRQDSEQKLALRCWTRFLSGYFQEAVQGWRLSRRVAPNLDFRSRGLMPASPAR